MSRWASGVAVLLAATAAGGVSAQEKATDANARGVTVLRPVEAPLPTPLPAPVPPAGPASVVAAPVAGPAVVAAPGRPTPSMPKACARPFARPAVTLGAGFDRALGGALKRRPDAAVVDLPQPFAVGDDLPTALAPWLNEVTASGGIVSAAEYCHDTRGLFGWIGRLVRKVRGSPYKAADGYDAVLHVDGLDQKVTQVEFRRRAS